MRRPTTVIHGCVTTGEDWQFLKLEGSQLGIDRQRYYLKEPGTILAIVLTIAGSPPGGS